MTRIVFFGPHPDDETLSAGLAMVSYLAGGCDVHVVGMSRGAVTAASVKLDGSGVCGYDNYTHNPVGEHYAVPTSDQIGTIRVNEAKSATGAMATITPSAGVSAGVMTYHEGHPTTGFLPDLYGSTGTNTIPGLTCTADGVALAQTLIKNYVDNYSNTFFFTMSPTDDHPDHAACGQALRNLKNDNVNICPGSGGLTYAQALVNSRFFVSRLYWDYSKNPDVAAQPDLQWFNAGTRKTDCDNTLRNQVIRCYSAWNPAEGSFGIGYHQVVNQFLANFGPGVSIGNLWHA